MIDWKLIVFKYLKVLLAGFMAGLMIALGSIAYVYISSIGYPIAAGLVASFGILMTCLYGYNLFSAKVGYALENNVLYILEIALSFIGNFLSVLLCGLIVKGTKLMTDTSAFKVTLEAMMNAKANDEVLSTVLLALLAGLLIYLAINTYKKAEQPIARFGAVILASIIIYVIGCGELTIDMFYVSCYKPFDGVLSLKLVYIAIGNIAGALLIPALNKLRSLMRTN